MGTVREYSRTVLVLATVANNIDKELATEKQH